MKRLSKIQLKRHEELSGKLSSAKEDLDDAITSFNEKVELLHNDLLQSKVDAFNEAIRQANEFTEEIHSEQEDYESERSDNWRDGDAGSAYQDWMSQWEMELEELELEPPTPFDEVEIETDNFANLDTEVSS